jgi:hypothetical protein
MYQKSLQFLKISVFLLPAIAGLFLVSNSVVRAQEAAPVETADVVEHELTNEKSSTTVNETVTELPLETYDPAVLVGDSTPTTPHPTSAQLAANTGLFAISAEFGGNTVAVQAARGEGSFNTLGGNSNPGQSAEGSFTTGTGASDTDEHSFTTDRDGGGGGGGGGGHRRKKTPTEPPAPCGLYLQEYIRLGRANNPVEVRKLQAFLNVFEGEKLPITGYYSQADFDAVMRFQTKYGRDVLGPWGIIQPTGYVFITTTYAINNIFCDRSTANDLDLRHFYPQVYETYQHQPVVPFVPQTDFELPEVTNPSDMGVNTPAPENHPNIFQLAAAGVLNLFNLDSCPSCFWIVLILIIIILILLYMIYRLNRKYRDALEMAEAQTYITPVPVSEGEEILVADEVSADDLNSEDGSQPTLTN